jgi:hypothetical protein
VVGKRKPAVGADPVLPRQLHANPPLHALALDKDNFMLEGRGQRPVQNPGKLLGQNFQAVAGIKI